METPQNRMESHRKSRVQLPKQDYKTMYCPNCGSGQIRTIKSEKISTTLRQRLHRCKVCVSEWQSVETIPLIDRDPNRGPDPKPSQRSTSPRVPPTGR